jgi:hypothetical protein
MNLGRRSSPHISNYAPVGTWALGVQSLGTGSDAPIRDFNAHAHVWAQSQPLNI